MIRLVARIVEPAHAHQHRGHAEAAADGAAASATAAPGMDDLLGRIGARIGLEAITRLHPADSHIPEKTSKILAAAWSDPAPAWPRARRSRGPLELWRPEIVNTARRGTDQTRRLARPVPLARPQLMKPAPPSARNGSRPNGGWTIPTGAAGVRDYWRVTTRSGERLWMYYGHGATNSPGWFCHGSFT